MLDTAHAVLKEHIKDLYNAEKQLVKALPKMAKAATTPALKEAFEAHLDETLVHVERLEQVAQILEFKPTGKKCAGMQGLIEEGSEVMQEEGEELCLDTAIIAAAQKVEHYEISAYGTAKALAQHLGIDEVVTLLETTLEEEKATDEKLTQICESQVLAAIAETQEEDTEMAAAGSNSNGSRGGNSNSSNSRSNSKRGSNGSARGGSQRSGSDSSRGSGTTRFSGGSRKR